jgi:EF hand
MTLLIGLALAGSALTVAAQPGPGRGPRGPHRYGAQQFPPPISAIFDTDTNNVLSEAEIAQAGAQLLKLDQNHDGQLTAGEFCPGGFGRGGQGCPWGGQGRGRRAGAGGQQCVLLALFDTDQDGTLSTAEINAAPTVLKGLDKNGDGQLTSDEIRPLPGCGRGCPWAQNQPQ